MDGKKILNFLTMEIIQLLSISVYMSLLITKVMNSITFTLGNFEGNHISAGINAAIKWPTITH